MLQWIEELRARRATESEKVALAEAMRANFGDAAVLDERVRNSVACLRIELQEREVRAWCQPLLFDPSERLCGLLVAVREGRLCALLQGVEEPGIIGGVQLGPTVQTDDRLPDGWLPPQVYAPFLREAAEGGALLDVTQAEEGGRFFHDKKRYLAALVRPESVPKPGARHRWVSLAATKRAVELTNLVNIFARSLVAMLS